MQTQRSLYFGPDQPRAPRKRGLNESVSRRRFPALRSEEIAVRFSNTTVTAFGGYPLWDRFLRRVGLDQKLAQHIKMDRGANAFSAPELSRFFIDTRILGAERLLHVNEMRDDPLLTKRYGIAYLPSDETLGRYFKSFENRHHDALDRLNVRVNNESWKTSRTKRRQRARHGKIVLDYDSSTMTVYGSQEGADRGRSFRKKDRPGFQPKFAFIGGLGVMAHQKLYPQSVNLDKEFWEFHRETLARLPKTATVWAIRGDGALYSEEIVKRLERKGYVYAISATRTRPLKKLIASLTEDAWEDGIDERGRPYSIARLRHRPSTWDEERTYVVSRRLKDLRGQEVLWNGARYKYFAYVTNFRAPRASQFRFCVERCSLESFIKESKSALNYDFLPCRELDANVAYLGHVQLAYNLLTWWKQLDLPDAVNRWTLRTIRDRLLRVCGNLCRRASGWVLSLPKEWPWRWVLEQSFRATCPAPS